MSFSKKVVLEVGASSGIGASTAVAFAKGANVVMVGRNDEKLKNVAAQCEKVGKKPLVIKADISKDDQARLVVAKTIEKRGTMDVLL